MVGSLCSVRYLSLATSLMFLVPDVCFNTIQFADQFKRPGRGFRVCLFGTLKITPCMRTAFRMGHQGVLSGIARIGFISVRDQCSAERLAQYITHMTRSP